MNAPPQTPRAPTAQQQLPLGTTPRISKPMTTHGAESQGLDAQRVALRASTTGHTVQVPVTTYFSTYQSNLLPSVDQTENLISSVETGLTKAKLLDESGWCDTQLQKTVGEDATYKGLEPIANKIASLCASWNRQKNKPKLPKRTTRLLCRPRHETASEVFGGSMMTDGRFVLMKTRDGNDKIDDKKVKTCDVGGVLEAKLDKKARGTNEDQVVGAVSHILYNDPSRRFVLSFTVEANMMRFWYFSRSHIAVSAEFDYHKNPRDFIRFIIFMMFAPLDKLGFDPTVRRVRDENNKIQYQFTVNDKKYQTIRCIDESSALDVVTRATRVWAVRILDANDQPIGETMVLKDVWLYIDAKSEQAIQKEIFDALKDLDKVGVPPDQRPPPSSPEATMVEDAKRYFMTIEEDIVVQINDQDDTTLATPDEAVDYCYAPLPKKPAAKKPTVEGGRGHTGLVGAGGGKASGKPQPTAPPPQASPAYPHTRRTHRRIIFAEECQSLYTVDNYGDFTLALAQLVYGLDYMRLAGFIHRDISPGNCLLYLKDRHIKISDLEYARRYDSQSQSALPLTGTPGFMAVEYQALKHHFKGSVEKTYTSALDADEDESEAEENTWFQFNFLHDLESVLWILLSHLLTTVPTCLHAGIDGIVERHTAVLNLYNDLFDGSLTGSAQRRDFIWDIKEADMTGFLKAKRVLAAFYEKANASALLKVMAGFKYLVGTCYKQVQATVPYDAEGQTSPRWDPVYFKHQFYSELHKVFMHMHNAMAGVEYHAGKELKKAPDAPLPAAARKNDDQVAPNTDPGPSRPPKRPAEAIVDEDRSKKAKTDALPRPSRLKKRSAEDAVERESTKKAKRAPAQAEEPPLRRSTRIQTATSSGASKGRRAPAKKTKQAAGTSGASSSRQPSGAGSSAAGTSGQPVIAPTRLRRSERAMATSKPTLRSATKKNKP